MLYLLVELFVLFLVFGFILYALSQVSFDPILTKWVRIGVLFVALLCFIGILLHGFGIGGNWGGSWGGPNLH